MTRQTSSPLAHLSLAASARQASEMASSFRHSFGLDLDPPYQRGRVWTTDQKIALIRSWLTGTPTGVVILNDRTTFDWKEANGNDPTENGGAMYACIDGQQRISTAYEWFDGELAVPASWFDSRDVTTTAATDDGPYVRYTGLSAPRQRQFKNRAHLQVAVAAVPTVEEEAAIYLLVNGGGTPQNDTDMENAARVAGRR
ncbi:DUF262 domain-containing protein [Embleya sp. MST-111070]|uniref:DUF262 domain-containing protein n=1 Tax=Embleya sp. MST-111070 TaxID=3398231 RepID=UPI003F736DBE